MITLETERLILKPIQLSDAEAIFHFFTKEVTTYMLPAPAEKIEDTESFINGAIKAREAHEEIVWVARLKYDDTFVGCFGLHKMNTDTPELGLWTQEGLFGKKLGLEGIKGIIKYAREHVPHHYLIYPVDRRNISSRNIPETLGGIVKKHYPKESASGSVLDIIEYWIYPETPQDFKPLTVLFQGDSITDCGRNRHDLASLGDGYVYQLKQSLPMVNVINKGISGDRTAELLARWQDDVIAFQPDVLSLLCGVNDVWHYFNFGKPIDEKTFESNYRQLIQMTKEQSPHTKMFLIEPFSFSIGAFDASWRPMLNSFINIVAKLAQEENLPLIHMDQHMKTWEKTYSAAALCGDGVHPSELGHQLMASILKPVIRNLLLEIDEQKL